MGKMECPRCKGKGFVEERRWDWVPGPCGTKVKKWRREEERYRCPICGGDGEVEDISEDGRYSKENVYWMGDRSNG